jgi:hypothetical protein
VDLAGNSHANYPEGRPSSLLSKTGNYTPTPTWEKDGSNIKKRKLSDLRLEPSKFSDYSK